MSEQDSNRAVSVVLFDAAHPPAGAACDGARRFEARGQSVVAGLQSPGYLILREPPATASDPLPAGAEVRVNSTYRELTRAVKDPAVTTGTSVLVVMVDIEPDHRLELEEGYGHHLSGRLRFPGFAASRLFKSTGGEGPEYLALYELTDPGAPTSPEYLGQPPDPTNTLIRDHAQLRVRQVYVEIG
jgi:hypothetical protein